MIRYWTGIIRHHRTMVKHELWICVSVVCVLIYVSIGSPMVTVRSDFLTNYFLSIYIFLSSSDDDNPLCHIV